MGQAKSGSRARAMRAHRKAVQSEIAAIAAFLEETLGRALVAHMTGVTDSKTVGRWASGQQPRPEAEERLRSIYHVFQLLQEHESPHTIRAWFVGLNPQLKDVSPASALHDGKLRDVLVAAKAFIAGG